MGNKKELQAQSKAAIPEHFQSERTTEKSSSTNSKVGLIINDLPRFFTKIDIENMCQIYGKVEAVKMCYDRQSVSIGTACVHFESNESAGKALEGLHGIDLFNKALSVYKIEKTTW